MTKRQELFCLAYIQNNYNATRAYKQVYDCADSTAEANSGKLMRNPEIRAKINEITKQIYDDQMISSERVATELARLAFSKDGQVSESGKLKALDLLQKQLGLQSQKVEANVKSDQIKIVINGGESDEE